jgi:hypothetical protein
MAVAKPFAVDLAASLAVCARAVNAAQTAGAPVGRATHKLLARVAAMVGGERATVRELEDLADRVDGDSSRLANKWQRVTGNEEERYGAAMRAADLVYTLGCLARKTTGWQKLAREILDDAALVAIGLRNAKRVLAEVQKAARTGLSASTVKPATRPNVPTPRAPDPSLARRIGELLFAELERQKARFVFTEGPAAAPVHAAAAAFDSVWGGLEFGDEDDPIKVGAVALAKLGESGGRPGRKHALVPVVITANDICYFLARDGRAWAQDTVAEPDATPYADNGDTMLARLLLFRIGFARQDRGLTQTAQGAHGAAWAKALHLPRIPRACDSLGSAWGDPVATVLEHRLDGAPVTIASFARKWVRTKLTRL